MSNSLSGGYIVRNENGFDTKYKCLVCLHLLKNPVQLDCGHRICHSCVDAQNNFVLCLECKEQTLLSEVKLDKGFHKDMQTLEVNCISCEWFGQLKNYQNHLERLHPQYKCSYCGEIFDSLPLHEQHMKKSCSKILVHCPLQQYGCREEILRGDLERHYRTKEHQRALLFCFDQLSSQWTEQYQASTNVDTHMKMKTSDHSSIVNTTSSTTILTDDHGNEHEYVNEMISLLSNGVQTLNDDVVRMNNESVENFESFKTIDEVLPTIKKSIEESNNILDAMNTNLTILHQELSSLKQKYEDKQATSYDGTLIWKISRFQEKMTDAKSERQVSIYSPPFFSSPTGYKMCARLYLYGDGNARRTHMSLFFVLMRGPNDSILQYPFSYKVTFCLFDQSDQRSHIIDSFRPDTKSNSFQRPRSDMNIASGIPKFVPINTVDNPNSPYVKDDTMFIKVIVDFENIAKNMLSYVFSLNPALPMHTQQRMIRQKIEKKAQQSQLTSQETPTNNEAKISSNNSKKH
ncbi:unnamed protein product [Rotaria sordida]|uniref:Uncharacterized protein n=1 Tax=Rotaria sordida TaxID=392033 RepID=A0A814NJZ8_9BILA|nr:unnamed protein product [Rotaria sordida]